jgi:hypothetical protein
MKQIRTSIGLSEPLQSRWRCSYDCDPCSSSEFAMDDSIIFEPEKLKALRRKEEKTFVILGLGVLLV